jgi:hypothetical protein
MGPTAISLDAAASPGAAVSAVATLASQGETKLIELDGLAGIAARMTDGGVHARIANLSPGNLQWMDPVQGGAGVAVPGDAFELPFPAPVASGRAPALPVCLQLVVAESVAITVTLSVVASAPNRLVLAQALVSR